MAVDLDDMFRRASGAIQSGNYDYAVALLREILQISPDHVKARAALRSCARKRFDEKGRVRAKIAGLVKGIFPYLRILLNTAKPNKAIEACEDYLLNDPYNIHVLMKEGSAARKASHLDLAVLAFEDIRQREPGLIKALRQLGEIHEEGKDDPHKALTYYQQIFQLVPADGVIAKKVKDLEARCHMQDTGITAESRFTDQIRDKEKQEELMKKDSEQFVVHTDDEVDAEIQKLAQQLKEDPKSIPHLMRLGELFSRKRDPKRAIAAFGKILEIDEKHYEARSRIGDIKLKHAEQKLKQMQEKLAESHDDALKAKVAAGQKELVKFRIDEYTWRVDAHPTDLKLKTAFGDALKDAGEIDQAIAQYQTASEDVRMRNRCRIALGECFMAKDQHKLAMSQFEHVVDTYAFLNDEAKFVHYNIALCAQNVNDLDKALEHYEQIYEADIQYRDVAKKIQELTAQKQSQS